MEVPQTTVIKGDATDNCLSSIHGLRNNINIENLLAVFNLACFFENMWKLAPALSFGSILPLSGFVFLSTKRCNTNEFLNALLFLVSKKTNVHSHKACLIFMGFVLSWSIKLIAVTSPGQLCPIMGK